jgi:hypothetical protein
VAGVRRCVSRTVAGGELFVGVGGAVSVWVRVEGYWPVLMCPRGVASGGVVAVWVLCEGCGRWGLCEGVWG